MRKTLDTQGNNIQKYELDDLPTDEYEGKVFISIYCGRQVLWQWDETHVYRDLWLEWWTEPNIFDKKTITKHT